MAIEWTRFQFISLTDDTSCWKYPSSDVSGDLCALDTELPKFPRHELIAARRSIWAVFDGQEVLERFGLPKIGATINRITDIIIDEGMNPTVAKKGESQ